MQCKNCGANLVRGFSFCLDCGMPVPPEALEESGLPLRNIDSGPQEPTDAPVFSETKNDEPETAGDVKPQMQGRAEESSGTDLKPKYLGGDAGIGGKALKPQLMGIGEETSGADLKAKPIGGTEQSVGGADVHAAMQNSSADAEDNGSEKLVFCPNCGMRMQHNGAVCDKCGMALGPKPSGAPSHGVPLFNNDTNAFGGQFGGELSGLSEDEASQIDSFMNGGLDPMFNSGNSSFNVQATPDDFAMLNEQLANFSSAAGMANIETTQNTLVRQKEPEKGMEREVSDFAMTDDLSSEPVPMALDGIPVVGDYSMEEDPNADINLDPYSFLYNSMDEYEMKVQEQYGTDALKAAEPSTIPSISANPTEPSAAQASPQEAPAVSAAVTEKPTEPTSISRPVPQAKDRAFAPSALNANAPANLTAAATAATAPVAPAPAAAAPVAPAPAAVAPVAPAPAAAAPVPATAPAPAAPAAPTKRCYACGHKMPINDKFCPNCGRSMFGAPNPNRMTPPPPAPKKKKHTALIVILIIVVAAAAAAVFFLKNANAAEISDETAAVAAVASQSLFL